MSGSPLDYYLDRVHMEWVTLFVEVHLMTQGVMVGATAVQAAFERYKPGWESRYMGDRTRAILAYAKVGNKMRSKK